MARRTEGVQLGMSARYQRSMRDLNNARTGREVFERAGRQNFADMYARRERTISRRKSLGGSGG